MTGKYDIAVRNNRVSFFLTAERNLTILRGKSGTGKTTLIGLLQAYEQFGEKSGVKVQCKRPCRILGGSNWELILEGIQESIVFVDEGNAFLKTEEFAKAIRNSSNYYVLITRESLFQLPYSVDAVLELKKTKSIKKCTYSRAYPYYKYLTGSSTLNKVAYIISEDSQAGYQMYCVIAKMFNAECVSANGKSNILETLFRLSEKQKLVIADGAAFGAEMEGVYRFTQLHGENTFLYLPESFEWLILSSGIIDEAEIKEILSAPSDHVDCEKYFSWEQFFTSRLIEYTKSTPLQYNKAHLAKAYLEEKNIEKLLAATVSDSGKS